MLKEFQNGRLIMSLCPLKQSGVFLVNNIAVDATLQHVFHDVISAALDSVENWCLPIVVDEVDVTTVRY